MEENATLVKKCLANSINWLAGAVTFPVALAGAQKYLWKPLRVSYSPTVRSSSVLGLASVTVASLGASSVALGSIYSIQKTRYSAIKLTPTYGDLFISTLSGVVLFKALGGQYAKVLPSNLMRPGAFAVESIPAMNESARATPKERQIVNFFGSKYGCHTCGKKRVTYIADHQPPSKLLGNKGKKPIHANPLLQRFYPQCPPCSHIQGGILAAHNGVAASRHPRALVTHSKLRGYHLVFCFPVPLCVTYFMGLSRPSNEPQRTAVKPQEVKTDVVKKTDVAIQTKQSPQNKDKNKSPGKRMSPETWLDVEVMLNFPLFIMWQRMVHFLDSFHDPLTTFHITLWAFIIIAALGTI